MKKMIVMCMMVICLATVGFPSTPLGIDSHWRWLEKSDTEGFDRLRAEYNDPMKLKEHFKKSILLQPVDEKGRVTFTRLFGVSDEVIRPILMDIIRTASSKNGWKWDNPNGIKEVDIANVQLREAISWLRVCADAETQQFLMDIAMDNAKYEDYRKTAASSYLYCANAQEMQDALARFSADTVLATLGTYGIATDAYDNAADDPKKREIIISMVSAALMKEENKIVFDYMDKFLAERSKEYADSPQRKAALERMNIPVEKGEQ